ncbi:MAG: septum formation initiator family protein [Lachnospiraceae bacterium]|nr:septum formation initiator family protein [Lachnospiraceae bacterium]
MANKKTVKTGNKRKEKRLIAILALVLCAVMFVGSLRLGNRVAEYEERENELQEQIAEQQKESERLQSESEYVKTIEYIEQIARQKLGMVKKDEIILKKDE